MNNFKVNKVFSVNERVIPCVIFFLACILYAGNLDFAVAGDAIIYANIIDTLRFDQLTIHQAYYLFGFLCKHLFGWLFNLSTDQSLVLMSALFGAASLCVAYLLLKHYLESEYIALLGVFILVLCHRFYFHATKPEIYIVQTFFIWSSYLLFEKKRFYTAGLSFALALWTSPLTIAFGLFFPVVAYIRGFGFRSLVRLAISVALIYVPFLFFFYEELLWGTRGVIGQDEEHKIDLMSGFYNFVKFQIKHYSFLNLLFIPALFALRREKHLVLISLAVLLPNIYVISQLRGEDNVFILTLDVFFAFWYTIGWRVLCGHSLAWLGVILLVAHSLVFLSTETPFFANSNKTYGDEFRSIGRIIRDTDDSILFANWCQRMPFIYYNRDSALFPLEKGPWYDLTVDITQFNKEKVEPENFAKYGSIFVLGAYSASPHVKLLLDDDTLNKRYEQRSERRQVERFLNVECQSIHSGILELYQCH